MATEEKINIIIEGNEKLRKKRLFDTYKLHLENRQKVYNEINAQVNEASQSLDDANDKITELTAIVNSYLQGQELTDEQKDVENNLKKAISDSEYLTNKLNNFTQMRNSWQSQIDLIQQNIDELS